MKRIHIVGISPRTGTTLLAEAMRISFDINQYEQHERPLHRLKFGSGIYLTKRPKDIHFLKMRLQLDPRLTIICMVRDPRDVIVSKHGKHPDEFYANLGNWKHRYSILKSLSGHPRVIQVKYEDLTRDPDTVQVMLQQKIEFLSEKKRFSRFHEIKTVSIEAQKALKGVRPIDQKSIGVWKSHPDRIKDQISEFGSICDSLMELGYEQDARWEDDLGLSGKPGKRAREQVNIIDRYFKAPSAALVAGLSYRLGVNLR